MFNHILQVLPALESGGVEQGTLELAEFLSQQGHRSSVASSGGKLAQRLTEWNVAHYQLPLDRKNPIQIMRNARHLERLINEQNIDLLHVRSRAPAWSVYLASRSTGVPFISTFHGCYGHKNALKRLYNSAMLRGRACIAVSEFIEHHIRETYPWAKNVVQINRGVDTDYYTRSIQVSPPISTHATKKPAQVTTSTKDPEKPFTLLLPGRFSELKGHQLLLDAVEPITDRPLKIIFVGSSHGKEHYYQLLRERATSLSPKIEFVNGHRDLREFYHQADAVVSATRKPESFGRTMIEAQAMQCLVLAPDQGANRSIIAPELQLGLFKANDSQSLTEKITALMSIPLKNRSLMGIAARNFVQLHFQRLQMTQKTLELYQQLWQDSTTLHGR